MTPDMVAALERQYTAEQTPGSNLQHRWRLVGEGLIIDLAVFESERHGAWVQWMGAHATRRFALDGEDSFPIARCQTVGGAGWCVVDASRGDRLIKAWAADRDDAPIWAALEELAGEVEW